MTLVLWTDVAEDGTLLTHPWEGAEHYKPNTELMKAITKFLEMYPTTGLTVWSGGGMTYARRWAEKFELPADAVMAKDIHVPSSGDICIDDQELKVQGRLVTPEQFIEMVNSYEQRNKIYMRARADDTHGLALEKGIY